MKAPIFIYYVQYFSFTVREKNKKKNVFEIYFGHSLRNVRIVNSDQGYTIQYVS